MSDLVQRFILEHCCDKKARVRSMGSIPALEADHYQRGDHLIPSGKYGDAKELLRNGNAETVAAWKFACQLRPRTKGPIPTRPHWDPTTNYMPLEDPLYRILRENLEKRGFNANYDTANAKYLSEKNEELHCYIQELAATVSEERKLLEKEEAESALISDRTKVFNDEIKIRGKIIITEQSAWREIERRNIFALSTKRKKRADGKKGNVNPLKSREVNRMDSPMQHPRQIAPTPMPITSSHMDDQQPREHVVNNQKPDDDRKKSSKPETTKEDSTTHKPEQKRETPPKEKEKNAQSTKVQPQVKPPAPPKEKDEESDNNAKKEPEQKQEEATAPMEKEVDGKDNKAPQQEVDSKEKEGKDQKVTEEPPVNSQNVDKKKESATQPENERYPSPAVTTSTATGDSKVNPIPQQRFLGCTLIEVPKLPSRSTTELVVNAMFHEGPAHAAGMDLADVVMAVNGTRVDNLAEMRAVMKTVSIGSLVAISVRRRAREMQFRLRVMTSDPSFKNHRYFFETEGKEKMTLPPQRSALASSK